MIPPFVGARGRIAELVTRQWLTATLTTLQNFVAGMALAIAVGIPLGVLMGRSCSADRLLGMWVNLFVSAPLSALVPILMILFGLGEATVIVTVFLFAVWIIVLDTRAGVMHVPPLWWRWPGVRRLALELYCKIIFWAALPEILAGHPPGHDPRRERRGHRPASGLDHRLWRVVRALFPQIRMERFWALTILVFAVGACWCPDSSAILKNVSNITLECDQ